MTDKEPSFWDKKYRRIMAAAAGGAVAGTAVAGMMIRADKRNMRFDGDLAFADSIRAIKKVHAARAAHEEARSDEERTAAEARLQKKIEKAEKVVGQDVEFLDKRAAQLEEKLQHVKDWDRSRRNRLEKRIDRIREKSDALHTLLLEATSLSYLGIRIDQVATDEQMREYRLAYVAGMAAEGQVASNPFLAYTSDKEWVTLLGLQDAAGFEARKFLLSPWSGLVAHRGSVFDRKAMSTYTGVSPSFKQKDGDTKLSKWFDYDGLTTAFSVNNYDFYTYEGVWYTRVGAEDAMVPVGFKLEYRPDDNGLMQLDSVATGLNKLRFLKYYNIRAQKEAASNANAAA